MPKARTVGLVLLGIGVAVIPFYAKRNGVVGAILLGLSLVNLWQKLPPKERRTWNHVTT